MRADPAIDGRNIPGCICGRIFKGLLAHPISARSYPFDLELG